MNRSRGTVWAVAVLVLVTTVLTGPAVHAVDVTREPGTFDGGNATVATVDVVDAPALEQGRFGTDVHYLRGATARVTVSEVTGTPRLLLRVEAPALEYDETATVVLREGERGQHRLSIDDATLQSDGIPAESITVRTTVRVQSFDGDRVVHRTNDTIGGGP